MIYFPVTDFYWSFQLIASSHPLADWASQTELLCYKQQPLSFLLWLHTRTFSDIRNHMKIGTNQIIQNQPALLNDAY